MRRAMSRIMGRVTCQLVHSSAPQGASTCPLISATRRVNWHVQVTWALQMGLGVGGDGWLKSRDR
jgi:hypothetical protein